ncbi:MAG: nucleotidyltransferase domain-containing protein [Chloroflexaceae bacterium]|nr:nucleotidyltransferase domain-containing protein [Chloroflexaceae bacterium]
MISREQIQQFSDAIVAHFQPHRIILFGSHAAGHPSPHADVDLLVILDHEGSGLGKAAEILTHLQPPFAVDLIVRSPATIAQRLAWNDTFLRDVLEQGQVLYATPDE